MEVIELFNGVEMQELESVSDMAQCPAESGPKMSGFRNCRNAFSDGIVKKHLRFGD